MSKITEQSDLLTIEENRGEILIYKRDNGLTNIEVKLEQETLWLTQQQMADVFGKAKSTINEHIKNIFAEGELQENSVIRNYRTTATDGKNYDVKYYNLEMIISVGYRVKSPEGTAFRQWATNILKEYLSKGFAMDDERLKQVGGGNYWKELLDRIRDIRSSEKVFYRQVLDLYATSKDYNPKSPESLQFFKVVQNKLHYATHGHTAAEIIYERVDAQKDSMGLTTFKGEQPTKQESQIAKNYLNENELKNLNLLVSGYFDFAELYANRHEHLYMQDYIDHLDSILKANGDKVLLTAGTISHKQAMQKVEAEYIKYQATTLTAVEKAYLENIKSLEKTAKKRVNK